MPLNYLKTGIILSAFLLLTACATAAKILYPVNDDPLKTKAGVYQLDASHANVIFAVNHLGFSFHHGRFNTIEGSLLLDPNAPENSKVFIKIKTDSIDTNNVELDTMLTAKNMLNAKDHPYISFESNAVTLLDAQNATITGDLILSGRKQPFSLKATFVGSGTNPLTGLQTIGFSGEGSLLRSEYGLTEWLPFVGDTVSFIIEAEFTRAK